MGGFSIGALIHYQDYFFLGGGSLLYPNPIRINVSPDVWSLGLPCYKKSV